MRERHAVFALLLHKRGKMRTLLSLLMLLPLRAPPLLFASLLRASHFASAKERYAAAEATLLLMLLCHCCHIVALRACRRLRLAPRAVARREQSRHTPCCALRDKIKMPLFIDWRVALLLILRRFCQRDARRVREE